MCARAQKWLHFPTPWCQVLTFMLFMTFIEATFCSMCVGLMLCWLCPFFPRRSIAESTTQEVQPWTQALDKDTFLKHIHALHPDKHKLTNKCDDAFGDHGLDCTFEAFVYCRKHDVKCPLTDHYLLCSGAIANERFHENVPDAEAVYLLRFTNDGPKCIAPESPANIKHRQQQICKECPGVPHEALPPLMQQRGVPERYWPTPGQVQASESYARSKARDEAEGQTRGELKTWCQQHIYSSAAALNIFMTFANLWRVDREETMIPLTCRYFVERSRLSSLV